MTRRGENIRKCKDGRWKARFPKGKEKKEIQFMTLSTDLSTMKQRKNDGNYYRIYLLFEIILLMVLLTTCFLIWIADSKVRLKTSIVYRYQYLIDTHIQPELGIKPVDNITSTVVNSFLADKLQNGRLDGSGGLSAAYVRSITMAINSAVRFWAE